MWGLQRDKLELAATLAAGVPARVELALSRVGHAAGEADELVLDRLAAFDNGKRTAEPRTPNLLEQRAKISVTVLVTFFSKMQVVVT